MQNASYVGLRGADTYPVNIVFTRRHRTGAFVDQAGHVYVGDQLKKVEPVVVAEPAPEAAKVGQVSRKRDERGRFVKVATAASTKAKASNRKVAVKVGRVRKPTTTAKAKALVKGSPARKATRKS